MMQIGNALRGKGSVKEALAAYETAVELHSRAIELDPKNAEGWRARGWVYVYTVLLQYDKGIADFNKAIELDPTLAVAWNDRGWAYFQFREYDKALADFNKAIELDPKHRAAWCNRGLVCNQLHQYERAIASFTQGIALQPEYIGFWSHRAYAYMQLGLPDEARADFAKAAELAGSDDRTWLNLAPLGHGIVSAYIKAGKTTEAAALANDQLASARRRLKPDSPELAGQLALTGSSFLNLRTYAEAELILRECLAIRAKHDPDAWTTCNARSMRGGALLGQKNYAEAEPLLLEGYEGMKQREAKMPPQVKDLRLRQALERLVQLHDAWGKPDEAAKWRKELQAAKKPEK